MTVAKNNSFSPVFSDIMASYVKMCTRIENGKRYTAEKQHLNSLIDGLSDDERGMLNCAGHAIARMAQGEHKRPS